MDIIKNLIDAKIVIALGLGFIVSVIMGPLFIPLLHKLKFGQNIREDGPKSHLKKAGTPTMGGIIFIVSTSIVALGVGFATDSTNISEIIAVVLAFLGFGVIGFIDDILKIIHRNNLGLRSWQKMILLLIVSTAIAVYAQRTVGTVIAIPFFNINLNLGYAYVVLAIFYFAGASNAVNLTDGLDGLATSITVLVATFFAIVSYNTGHMSLAIFCVALAGALLGFLKFNAFPARIFMGDTGSLALGGAIATVALLLKMPILLAIVGGIYVLETVSVILQVGSYKLRKKRIFKMAPIHHHFEQVGWSETKIVSIFSVITVILCFIGFLSI
ncbi:phospho-N-acetylmuramoyl-pentapeptide-transferase [uncultured Clostridium sp.]|uniref:phospho-N-acetylmuramoyl-pentapeptide- transferase n=1 Tax=uncultured Clostridium sp. TaxID=59620 RepID=UPI00261DF3DC|nr:phospho-N-acetylmuramoyl-pentapeptide-transferase [uncultured Clostridium sp.]